MQSIRFYLLFIAVLLSACGGAEPATAAVAGTSGPWGIDAGGFKNFSAAVHSPATAGKAIVVSKPMTVNNLTVPADRTVRFAAGGSITVASGKVLRMPVPEAGDFRIFNGSGVVRFNPSRGGEARMAWWGVACNGSTDDTATGQAAIDAVINSYPVGASDKSHVGNSFIPLVAPAGVCMVDTWTAWLDGGSGLTLRGQGSYDTVVKKRTNAATPLLHLGSPAAGATDLGNYVGDLRNIALVGYDTIKTTPIILSAVSWVRSTMEDVRIEQGAIGLQVLGAVDLKIRDSQLRNNNYGVRLNKNAHSTGLSNINLVTFEQVAIAENALAGADINYASSVTFNECDIEQNGTTLAAAGQGGIITGANMVTNLGHESIGVIAANCWFEANRGTADIVVNSAYNIVRDSYFVLGSNVRFNLRVEAGRYSMSGCTADAVNLNSVSESASVGSYSAIRDSVFETAISVNPFKSWVENVKAGAAFFWEKQLASLTNGWVAFGAPYEAPGYIRQPDGTVHLYGVAKSGTLGQIAFTLPVQYRPLTRHSYPVMSDNTFGRVDVFADGTVVIAPSSLPASTSNAFVSLNGISFKAEQ